MTEDHESFLDDLRDSGIINMFEARASLQKQFPELTKQEARDILKTWMEKKTAEAMQ